MSRARCAFSLLIDHGWRNLFFGAGVVALLLVPIRLLLRKRFTLQTPNDDRVPDPGEDLSLPCLPKHLHTVIASLTIFCLLW